MTIYSFNNITDFFIFNENYAPAGPPFKKAAHLLNPQKRADFVNLSRNTQLNILINYASSSSATAFPLLTLTNPASSYTPSNTNDFFIFNENYAPAGPPFKKAAHLLNPQKRADFVNLSRNTQLNILINYASSSSATLFPFNVLGYYIQSQQTIEQRRLPVPEDLSNSVIFSTNFYSATDLSNGIGSVPSNLFDSCGNTDISFTTARDFWLGEISYNDYLDASNSGITIITIQNLTSDHTIGAHTLQFLNWDISSNKKFGENASNNEKMFTGDGSNNLANTMQFISGIRTIPKITGTDLVNLPLAIVSSNNNYNSFSTISGDSLNDLSNQFLNYMIVLGRPILVNIANLYDNISLTNIVNNKVNDSSTNLINWRSSSPYGSSANNVWIKDNKLYDSESNGNELPFPLILVPGVTYNITNISEINIEFTLDIQDHFIINGIIPINLKIELQVLVTHTKRVTTNKQMNSNFELTDLTTL